MNSKPVFATVIATLVVVAAGLAVIVATKIRSDLAGARSGAPAPSSPQSKLPAPARPDSPAGRPVPQAKHAEPRRSASPAWVKSMEAGLAAYRDKRPDEARNLYADALVAADKSGIRAARALVLSNTGSLFWSMRKLDEAEVYLLRAAAITDALGQAEIEADLGKPQVFLVERTERMLGVVYRDQGKHADAASHFAKAVMASRKLSGVRPEALGMTLASDLYELGGAQCRLGDPGAARATLGQALKASPGTPSTAHQAKAIDSLLADIDKGQRCRR